MTLTISVKNTTKRVESLKIILKIITLLVIYVIYNLFSSRTVYSQSCGSCGGNGAYCRTSCGEDGCWDCYNGTWSCCHCEHGYDQNDHGPLICSNSACSNSDAPGCRSVPTSPPQDTATPTQTNTPTPARFWICERPYASPPFRCDYEPFNCRNPDASGGACYRERDTCEHGCNILGNTVTPRPTLNPLCTYAPGRYGILSAIGCIPVDDNNQLTIFMLRWALGVASGITFLLIIYSAFLIMGSGGNTEKVKSGKMLLTAALTGLILIIFSVFVLDIFGIRILQLPGL